MRVRLAPAVLLLVAVACGRSSGGDAPPAGSASRPSPRAQRATPTLAELQAAALAKQPAEARRFEAVGAALEGRSKALGAKLAAEDGALALAFRGGKRDASFRVARVGRPGALEDVTGDYKLGCAAAPGPACVERASREGTLVEWWENRPTGLEHALRLDDAPEGRGDVVIELEVGFADVAVGEDGKTVEIVPLHGPALRYSKLSVRDAAGREIAARFEATEGGVSIRFADDGAEYPVVVDPELASAPVARTWEASDVGAYGELGWSVTSAGDVNGDGYDDVLVGTHAPRSDRPSSSYVSGRVFLFMGGPSGPTTTAWTAGWSASKNQPATAIGLGDVNGDGYDDISVFAHLGSGGDETTGSRIYLGSAAGLARKPALQLERRIAWPIGDVDGDGTADVAAAWLDKEVVEIIPGSRGTLAATSFFVEAPGRAMEITHGDFDGDKREDFAIGLPWSGAKQEGSVLVFSGAAGFTTTPSQTLLGAEGDAHFGVSVQSARDVDGDGRDDLLVARSAKPWSGDHDGGFVGLHLGSPSGVSATPGWTLSGMRGLGFHGPGELSWGIQAYTTVMAAAGDLDGDGYGDVIVGAPEEPSSAGGTGKAMIFMGGKDGLGAEPAVVYELPDVPGADKLGARAGRIFLGHAVSGVGDVNGDGHPDVLVSADSYASAWDKNVGSAMVWMGASYAGGLVCLNDCAGARWAPLALPTVTASGCVVASAGRREVDAADDVACTRCTAAEPGLCSGKRNACNDETGSCSRCDADLGGAGKAPCRDPAAPLCTRTGPRTGVCQAACTGDYKSGAAKTCLAAVPVCVTSGADAGRCFACDGDHGAGTPHACHTTLGRTKCVTSGPNAGTCRLPPKPPKPPKKGGATNALRGRGFASWSVPALVFDVAKGLFARLRAR